MTRRWTPAEDQAIRAHAAAGQPWKLLDLPGRTLWAVSYRAAVLGVRNGRIGSDAWVWTPERIAQAERMRAQGMLWKAIAGELGMAPHAVMMALMRARRRHEIPTDRPGRVSAPAVGDAHGSAVGVSSRTIPAAPGGGDTLAAGVRASAAVSSLERVA